MMFEAGHRIGNYEILRRVSAGGMATLYLARRVGAAGFTRPVALKVIHPHLAEDAEFSAMFVDEANLSARIDHPNVVHVEELGQIQNTNTLFLAMEFVDGCSLAHVVKRLANTGQRLSPELAAAIIAQVAAGLHAAHETVDDDGFLLGVVHRDVTPQNILLSYEGHVKVIDFGIAKSSQRARTTRAGVLMGKLRFMSPEQAWSEPLDRRSDIFSLAIVFWELLTSTPLFDGKDDVEIIHKLRTANVVPPRLAGATSSEALDGVILKALAVNPDDRPTTALEFRRLILDAVPRAASIDAGELSAVVKTVVPNARLSRSEVSAPTATARHSVAPPSFDAASGTASSTRNGGADRGSSSLKTPPAIERQGDTEPGRHDPAPAREATRRRTPLVAAGLTLLVASAAAMLAFKTRTDSATRPLVDAPQPSVTTAVPPPPSCPNGMIKIPAGAFFMGSDDKDDFDFEKPAHRIVLSQPFCIDTFEVTTEDYKAASDSGEVKRASQSNDWDGITANEHKAFDPLCNLRAPEDRGKHPINCVSWDLADAYCKAMKKRLPTEAEWEYAARGPDGRKYPWGDELPGPNFLNACGKECIAWGKRNHLDPTGMGVGMYSDDDGYPTTAPVGSFPAGKSRYGVQDVVGNVWEWVADRYAPYTADEQTDPKGPLTGDDRVARGGAWNGAMASWVRPTFRFHYAPSMRSHGVGFRCASSL